MKLSICIVNWEGGEIFEKCLKSITKNCKLSKIFDYEIIVVDNNSTHLNYKILKKTPKLKLIKNKKNNYFSVGTNQSIKASSGNYILILNNDVILKKNVIELLLNNIKNYDAINPSLELPNKTIQKSMPYIPTIKEVILSAFGFGLICPSLDLWPSDNTDYSEPKIISTRNQPAFSAILIKRKTWNTVGVLDYKLPLLWNDTDWFYRFHSKNMKCLYYPKARVFHIHGLSVDKHRLNKIYQSTISMQYFLTKTYKPSKILKPIIKLFCYITMIERIIREIIIMILQQVYKFQVSKFLL